MKIPLVDIRAEVSFLRAEIEAALSRVLDSGRFILGPEVEALEEELGALGGGQAIGVSSGTDALLVALMAMGITSGDEVITTPFSFFATAGVVARVGARPVFADIDEESLNLDPNKALEALGERSRAIITVHLYGRPAVLPSAGAVPIVEDAAQAIGARPLHGAVATLSFFPSKNVGALGDGGAVIARDPVLADRIRVLRVQGARPKYFHELIGGNFRLDALQAAVIRTKLPHLAFWIQARRANAARYRDLFAAAAIPAEVRLPPASSDHTYNQFVLRVPRRDELRQHLAAAGVGTEVYYPRPLHLQPSFSYLGYREGSLPVAERAARDVLAIPIHPFLTETQQQIVVEEIAAFYRTRRGQRQQLAP